MYPKLVDLMGDKMFMTEHFKFFIGLMEDLMKQRAASKQVTWIGILY